MKKLICILLAVLLLFSACESRKVKESPESEVSEEGSSAQELSSDAAAPDSVSDEASASVTLEPATAAGTSAVTGEAAPITFTLVVPEGYTLARIGMVLEDKGVCTADEFIAATQNGDFADYPLIAEQTERSERCFNLEGYLFPDTYDVYYQETPDSIIRKMLDHTEQKINADLRAEIAESGYTVDEIITMASIIEKEAFGDEHMPNISSVLHNRLDSGMRLQCDVTITYVEGAIKPFISGDVNRFNSFYNTYKCAALPAGAICNPGLTAIKAAIRPADTDYLYFVTDSESNYYYAATWEEHEANVAVALGDNDE